MQLLVTTTAQEQINSLNKRNYRYLLLWYDIEGCGCGVNGVPMIKLTNEKTKYDDDVENDFFPTIIHRQQAIFFAENMKLDFVNGTFRLASPGEILNPFISPQRLLEEDVTSNRVE